VRLGLLRLSAARHGEDGQAWHGGARTGKDGRGVSW
jgi:hypothetical protein